MAGSLTNLGGLYVDQGQDAKADEFFKRAQAIYEKALPKEVDVAEDVGDDEEPEPSPDAVVADDGWETLVTEVDERLRVGDHEGASALAEKALKLVEEQIDPNLPDVAEHLVYLAGSYQEFGQYADAEHLFQRAIAIFEKADGPDHPSVARSLNYLATHYVDQGQLAQAEPLLQRALGIYEKALGPDHPRVAKNLYDLAELYRTLGRYAEAEPLYERALSILENARISNRKDFDVPGNLSLVLQGFAELFRSQGQDAKADQVHQRAKAIYEEALPQIVDVDQSVGGTEAPKLTHGTGGTGEKLHVLHTEDREHPLGGDDEAATALAEQALKLAEEDVGPDHLDVAMKLCDLGLLYMTQGKYAQAKPVYQRALAILEKALTESPQDSYTPLQFKLSPIGSVAMNLYSLAFRYQTESHYTEAEPLYQRALVIFEKGLTEDPNDPDLLMQMDLTLTGLSELFRAKGDHAKADELNERAFAIWTGPNWEALMAQAVRHISARNYKQAAVLAAHALKLAEEYVGPESPSAAMSLLNLATLSYSQGRYAQAESLLKRALEIYAIVRSPDHPDVALALNNLGEVYKDQGQYAQAEPLMQRALAINEKAMSSYHPKVARSLNNLGLLYQAQGKYAQAEPLMKRALAIYEKVLGPDHTDVALSLNNIAFLCTAQGQYAQAEPLFQRALAINEKALGPDHPSVALILNNIAVMYRLQGQYAQAEPLLQRVLAINEKALSSDHPAVALSLNNLAELYYKVGQYAQAEPLLQRALAINEKALGPDHPSVALSLNNLALLYETQDRYGQVEPLLKRALAINEKALGRDNPDVANSLKNLAGMYGRQGQYAQAEPLYQRAQVIRENALGRDHPLVALSLNDLASLYGTHGQYAQALPYARSASQIYRRRIVDGGADDGAAQEATANRGGFSRHLSLLAHNPGQEPAGRVTDESFQITQLAQASGTGAAVAQMAVRFAKGDDAIASLVKRKQDAAQRRSKAEDSLVQASSQPPAQRNVEREAQLRTDITSLGQELETINAELDRSFPEYQELTRPESLTVAQVQALLRPKEAMLVYAIAEDEGWLWVVRPNRAEFLSLTAEQKTLAEQVKRIRKQMEFTESGHLQKVDVALLHTLYQQLFAPAQAHLDGIDDLMVVPAGPLQSLPFSMLVATEPKPIASDDDYAKIDWLVKHYAFSVLPSVSSIRAFRQFAKSGTAQDPFIGFGDPLLREGSGTQRTLAIDPSELFRGLKVVPHASTASKAQLQLQFGRPQPAAAAAPRQPDIADVGIIRQQVRLPETAGEVKAMAQIMKAGENTIWLQGKATESNVKSLNLLSYRVIAFATHGVMAGEMPGGMEAGLLLTPPDKGTLEDDGYLAAGEIAQLKLNADWVLLSACNTAAPDGTPGAEGLSGLAKAFFYAGTRSLLVSHWPVASEATVPLTTGMLQEYEENPAQGKSEAQRKAMLALINTPGHPEYAHPLYWAPFVVVGEGAGAK